MGKTFGFARLGLQCLSAVCPRRTTIRQQWRHWWKRSPMPFGGLSTEDLQSGLDPSTFYRVSNAFRRFVHGGQD